MIQQRPLQVFCTGSEALVSSSGMSKDVHSLMLSIQHFLCRPRRRPPSKIPERMVWAGLLWWRVTCPKPASLRLLTVARSSCGPIRKLILFHTQSLVLCSKWKMQRGFLKHLVSKAWILFNQSVSRVHVSQPLKRLEATRNLYSLNLLEKLMALHHQTLFSLAILMRTSAEQVPSLHRVAPKYLRLVTSSTSGCSC